MTFLQTDKSKELAGIQSQYGSMEKYNFCFYQYMQGKHVELALEHVNGCNTAEKLDTF